MVSGRQFVDLGYTKIWFIYSLIFLKGDAMNHNFEIFSEKEIDIAIKAIQSVIYKRMSREKTSVISNIRRSISRNKNRSKKGHYREDLAVAIIDAARDAGLLPWVVDVKRCEPNSALDVDKIDFVIKTSFVDTPFLYFQCKSSQVRRVVHYEWQYENAEQEDIVPCVVVNEEGRCSAQVLLDILIEILRFKPSLGPTLVGRDVIDSVAFG